ncbi:MAG: AmmeMemoRadiSam system protein B, partial [Nanohaloarchaea archaeon]|nr:AmmeMemoRadiSam system protein B [Candidatus Nanohaloarchaea archaeon]
MTQQKPAINNIRLKNHIITMAREPVAEGFYPGDAKILKLMLDRLFKDTEKTVDRKVIGLIAPHAGYLYSGKTAAKAYAQIEKE